MLTLFHSPGSCSNGILILLNEIGADFTVETVNVRKKQQHEPAFLARNPKGKVPALMLDDGSVISEFQAIAYWLGNAYPESGVWPKDPRRQTEVLSALEFLVASVHMRGLTFMKMPNKFHGDKKMQRDLVDYGRSEVEKGLAILSEILGDKEFLFGEFTIADAALFYVLTWSQQEGITLPDNLARCLERLSTRASVMKAEGNLEPVGRKLA